MFRKMRRFKQELSKEECIKVLKEQPRGVLAVSGDDRYPYTVPIDFSYDEKTNTIGFHCAKEGHKIDAVRRCDKASFCVYDEGFRKEGDWALNIKSVIVFGRIHIVESREQTLDIARRIGHKFYPDKEEADREVIKYADKVMCLELIPEHITGKLVNES